MAKKQGAAMRVNKTEEIKKYLRENPAAGPTTVVAALKERGINLSGSLVSAVKYKGGSGKAATKKVDGQQKMATSGTKATSISAADLLEAKKLVDHLGGIGQAQKALETLEQLR